MSLLRRPRLDPRRIVLRDIELLELDPRGDYLGTRRFLVRRQELSDEVVVATDSDPLESLHPVQGNIVPDEIAICRARALRDLFFSPAVQPIPDSGLLANVRRYPPALFDDEVLRFTVARVVLDPELQVEATFDVLEARPAQ